ncbi:MAG: hypothetical protein QG669_275, partial [Patescibacteria group bacterium]|nr:hypothetical protein [Patescibacteria group bacterium]
IVSKYHHVQKTSDDSTEYKRTYDEKWNGVTFEYHT